MFNASNLGRFAGFGASCASILPVFLLASRALASPEAPNLVLMVPGLWPQTYSGTAWPTSPSLRDPTLLAHGGGRWW